MGFGFLPFLRLGSWTVKVTTQVPDFRVFSLEPDFAQIRFEALATLKVTLAFFETSVTPTRLAKALAEYFFLATRAEIGLIDQFA
ncbi:unannotated protein [freshwater metagenome]|uniref:Unannotated protein n=1 Tax=freshwater metagenome TaxID=449393 RepID=A0A6J5ZBJ0_9ZZZZ